ncbi:MAG: ferric iron reductase protein FhuF [Halomonadaceae bacterium T82-2]|nr:MAG: ferric iron reductase protein FhuF [Halomonadaceae bacterium T82-2]
MLPSLAPLFRGPLAGLDDRLRLPDAAASANTRAASALFSTDGLAPALAVFGRDYTRPDHRALVSLWSKYFLAQAILVPAAAALVLGRRLPMALETLALELDAAGRVARLVVPHEGEMIEADDPEPLLRPLLDRLLAPAIAVMAAHGGLAPRTLWSNAGHYYAYLIDQLRGQAWAAPGLGLGEALMARRVFADGARNPLHRPVRQVRDADGTCHTRRRLCCVRYRLPELGYCGNCPLPAARGVSSEGE